MAVNLYCIHTLTNTLRNTGKKINENNLFQFLQIAKKNNLKNLPFIDTFGNTIFNQKQLKEIKKELEFLAQQDNINTDTLKIISQAVDLALKNPRTYLLIEGG